MTRPAWLPERTDLLIAVGFVALVAAEGLAADTLIRVDGGPRIESPVLYLVLAVPAMASLAVRRRFPTFVAVVVVAANFVLNADGKTSIVLAAVIAAYSIGAHSKHPQVGLGAALTLFFLQWAASSDALVPSDVAAGLVFLGAPWAVGRFVAARDSTATAATLRAELLEREQHALAAAAAAEERVRLARELHDVVSHSISVIAVQTQAVRRRLHPELSREVDDLLLVESTARDAMAEMRRLFGVLRSAGDDVAMAPQPGLDQLGQLVGHVRSTGLDVQLESGVDGTALTPGLSLAAYRIVQEALTNVMKHAAATSATVRVDREGDCLDISIEDDGRGLTGSSGGHGLRGIRERAELYGGTLDVGQSLLGGVRVAARLPVGASS